jgi:farnesyl diphosphate synthase
LPSTAQQRFEKALAHEAGATHARLSRLVSGSLSARLGSAMRYATLAGGKRLRPFLVIQSGTLFNVPRARLLRIAVALECVHTYSLVHDDLPAMDDDDLRRGKPTTHRKFDEATAILAGDALLTLAFELLASPKTNPEARVRSLLIEELARAAGQRGMVAGQMLDIEAESKGKQSLSAIRRIQQLKTGALFRFACESGAIMAGVPRSNLRRFADHMGLAFQIADDVLDVASSALQLGKATQKDKRAGKATFVDHLGVEGARRAAEREAEQAIAALKPYGAKADLLREAARFAANRKS